MTDIPIQIINGTSSVIIQTADPWLIFATFLAAIGAVATALIAGFFHRKNLEFDSMLKTLSILTDDKHRESRKRVCDAFKKYVKNHDLSVFKECKKDVGCVRADFADIAVLIYGEIDWNLVKKELKKDEKEMRHLDRKYGIKFVRKGTLTKNLFLSAYSGSVINCWYALEHKIEYDRVHTRADHFMLNFELLFRDALRFKHERKLGDSEIQKIYNNHKDELDELKKKIRNKEIKLNDKGNL